MARVIRDSVGDCSYDGGHTWQKCPVNNSSQNNSSMANLSVSPALAQLVDGTTDKIGAISNFVVDNNEAGVFAVLSANGYTFTTHGEAAIIVKSIILGTSTKQQSEFMQLSQVPYINSNTNGTGGLKGDINASTTAGIGDDLLCTVGTLFGYPIGCTAKLTPEQIAAQQKAAADAQKAKTQNTIIIVSIIGVILIVITVLYLKNKKK